MGKTVIKFSKTREAKLPSRGHAHDAGIDFYVPKFDKSFLEVLREKNKEMFQDNYGSDVAYCNAHGTLTLSGGAGPVADVKFDLRDENSDIIKFDAEKGLAYFLLAPLSRVNIPSGIYCQMAEPGRALIAANKSGVASRDGLIFGAQVVDYEYQGEIHINVINTSSKVVRIYEDQKLIQFLETPIFTSDIEEVDSLQNLYKKATSRADGGFGSTDKKQ